MIYNYNVKDQEKGQEGGGWMMVKGEVTNRGRNWQEVENNRLNNDRNEQNRLDNQTRATGVNN